MLVPQLQTQTGPCSAQKTENLMKAWVNPDRPPRLGPPGPYFRLALVSVAWKTLDADIRFSMYWPRTWFSDFSFRFSSLTASTRADRSGGNTCESGNPGGGRQCVCVRCYLRACAEAPVPGLSTWSSPPSPPGSPHHLKHQHGSPSPPVATGQTLNWCEQTDRRGRSSWWTAPSPLVKTAWRTRCLLHTGSGQRQRLTEATMAARPAGGPKGEQLRLLVDVHPPISRRFTAPSITGPCSAWMRLSRRAHWTVGAGWRLQRDVTTCVR